MSEYTSTKDKVVELMVWSVEYLEYLRYLGWKSQFGSVIQHGSLKLLGLTTRLRLDN